MYRYLLFREPNIDWADKLVLPTRFSTPTTEAIKTGVLTKSVRVEIVDSLSTLMLIHTSRPTPHDLDTICRRLIEKFPKLKDTVDNGYVSSCIASGVLIVIPQLFRVLGDSNYVRSLKTYVVLTVLRRQALWSLLPQRG